MKDRDFEPRKAPRQARAKETVDAVFEAMLQVLAKQDADDPSVQAIADRAGVSVGSVYQYFPSKTSLVNALIGYHLRKQMAGLEESVAKAQATALDAEAAARFLVDAVVDDKRTHSKLERGLIRYFLRAGDFRALTQSDDQMLAIVLRFLEGLGSQVRATDLPMAAFIVSNALRSAVLLSIVQAPERLDDPRFKAELVHLVVGYLRP